MSSKISSGLRITHGCFQGSPGTFNEWRGHLARGIGIENIKEMEYYKWPGGESWDTYADDPLTKLLIHSDNEGVLKIQETQKIIERIKEISPKLTPNSFFDEITEKFLKGAQSAVIKKENLRFL